MSQNEFLGKKLDDFFERVKEPFKEVRDAGYNPPPGQTIIGNPLNFSSSGSRLDRLIDVVTVLTSEADRLDTEYIVLTNSRLELYEHQFETFFDPGRISRYRSKMREIDYRIKILLEKLIDVRRWQALALMFLYEFVLQEGDGLQKNRLYPHLLQLTDEGMHSIYSKTWTTRTDEELLRAPPVEEKQRPLRLTREQEKNLNELIVRSHDHMFDEGKSNDEIWQVLSKASEDELGFHLTLMRFEVAMNAIGKE